MIDFNENRDEGQLWLADRRWLYETCIALRPMIAVETGTFNGAGSTFFIGSALHQNQAGKLYTIEGDPRRYNEAAAAYHDRWPHLAPFVTLYFGNTVDLIPNFLASLKQPIDFVFLDSSDAHTQQEFELLSPSLRVGGVLMAHDWSVGKCEGIKPILAKGVKAGAWQVETIGEGFGSFESGSLGMCKATKLKP